MPSHLIWRSAFFPASASCVKTTYTPFLKGCLFQGNTNLAYQRHVNFLPVFSSLPALLLLLFLGQVMFGIQPQPELGQSVSAYKSQACSLLVYGEVVTVREIE